MTSSHARDALVAGTFEVLAGTPLAMRGLLGALPEGLATDPADDGWSPRDVLAHLLSVEPWAFADRVRLMLDTDDPAVPNVDEADVLARSGLRARPIDSLLAEFERTRRANLSWVEALTAEQLAHTGRHEQVGSITVANVLHHIAFHDLNHVRQITSMLEPPLNDGRGHMRNVY